MIGKLTFDLVVFVAVSLCLQNHIGLSFNIEINPYDVNGLIHSETHISCKVDNTDGNVEEVMLLEVSKEDKAIGILRQNKKVSVPDGMESKFKVKGSISSKVSESYLEVTISDPRKEDSGTYTCLVYYLDESDLLQETRSSANLTVTDIEVKTTLGFLMEKVANLEKAIKDQGKQQMFTEMFVATHGDRRSYSQGDVIIYNKVITDEGQGYDSKSGTFTAPKSGYYLFRLSLEVISGGYLYVDIKSSTGKSFTRIQIGHVDHAGDYSEGMCIAKLNAGEKVMPVLSINSGIIIPAVTKESLNQFSGYLLKTL